MAPFFARFVSRNGTGEQMELEWIEKGEPEVVRGPGQMSDGTLRFVCLMALLLQPTDLQPRTIFIDEPELGMHPYALGVLSDVLRDVSRRRQLIVATQCPDLVSGLETEEVVVVNRKGAESSFERPDAERLRRWREDFRLGDLWKMNVIGGAAGVVTALVVCEGQTEETFVGQVLASFVAPRGIRVSARLLETSPGYAGGGLGRAIVLGTLCDALREREDLYLATLFDLFGLPKRFPGLSEASREDDPLERARRVEEGLHRRVVAESGCAPERFFPHVQPYEFESLLFADAGKFAEVNPAWAGRSGVAPECGGRRGDTGAHQRWRGHATVEAACNAPPIQEDLAWRGGGGPDRCGADTAGVSALRWLGVAAGGPVAARGKRLMPFFTESLVEEAALDWFRKLDYLVDGGPERPPGEVGSRRNYSEVVHWASLQGALRRLNQHLPEDTLLEAARRVQNPEGATLDARNRNFHRMLVEGVPVEYRDESGDLLGARVRVVDFDRPGENFFKAVSQFTVEEGGRRRRPDLVILLNGLPVGILELKSPSDPDATVWSAWNQIQTYRKELPTLFSFNEVVAVSDGMEARLGAFSSPREWFKPWRTIGGEELAPVFLTGLQVLVEGVFQKRRFLDLLRGFVVFEDDGYGAPEKKIAGYHQFHAVKKAVKETLRAAAREADRVEEPLLEYETRELFGGKPGDRRIGVLWHTQGSGKSLTMAFFVGEIVREPEMKNPTVVVMTDRNDLDDQLFATFSRCGDLLRQTPVKARDREDLRRRLSVESGGVVFTTVQKFFPDGKGERHPVLSVRGNIVVIADEAHRSQYDFVDGFAAHIRDALPNASFVGFTGTPIETRDANTRAVFGDYISIYDIGRSVEDGATVPIYYESRLAELALDEAERPNIDIEFEEVTEGEESARKEKIKNKWAQLESAGGGGRPARPGGRRPRGALRAAGRGDGGQGDGRHDVPPHRGRDVPSADQSSPGLAFGRGRPGRAQGRDDRERLGSGGTGSGTSGTKARRERLARRFRDPEDPLRMVIVRDMWLTGLDAPSLHTMYVDKPMRGHGLMQAIARVNRVFRDKPGGLVVDYLGVAHELKRALRTYTDQGEERKAAFDQAEAIALMREKYEVCCGLFHGLDRSRWLDGTPEERLGLLLLAQEHILAQRDGKERLAAAVADLTRAFALSVPSREALDIRDEVAFFQAVNAALSKRAAAERRPEDELAHAVRQIVSKAVVSKGITDIFAAAGLDQPDVSVLSEEFLAEVRGLPQKNLAVELLQKLLRGEVRARGKKNVIQARAFSEMLERTLLKYRNRAVEAAQVIEELIAIAREMREARGRGEKLGLSEEEMAFYDALETNDSAVKVLGDEALRGIARELVETVRNSVTVDWTLRESARANIRRLVKRVLRKHGYPPDKQEKATRTVLDQAEAISADWPETASSAV